MFDQNMAEPSRDSGISDARERLRDKPKAADDKSGREKGAIARVKPSGFGFIQPAAGNKEIFFHSTGMAVRGTFDELRAGDEVTYKMGIDKRTDKEMAIDIEIVGYSSGSGSRLRGAIVRLMPKGFGFIEPYKGGDKIYFHSTCLIHGGFDYLCEGDEVEYEEGMDKKSGKPWAEKVRTCQRKVSRDYQMPMQMPSRNLEEGGLKRGRISNLNIKGFGFIKPDSGEDKIYFHSTCMEVANTFDFLEVGQEVMYKKGWDKKTDKWMAESVSVRDVRDLMRGPPPPRSQYSEMSFLSMQDNLGRGRGWTPRPRSASARIDNSMNWMREGEMSRPRGQLFGRVGLKNDKGFGFIEEFNGGERIYFHTTSMLIGAFDKLEEGDKVSFIMGWDRKNKKEMAECVRVLSKVPQETKDEDWIGKLTGRISRLHEKGFGFINTGEGDIYFHSSCLSQVGFNDIKVGDDVAYIRGWDKRRGKDMAEMVELRYNDRSMKNREVSEEAGSKPYQEKEADAKPTSRIGNIDQLDSKGFGFIKSDGGNTRIYFHSSSLTMKGTFDDLKEGDAVVYEEGWDRSRNKPVAVRVELQ